MRRWRISLATKALGFQLAALLTVAGAVAVTRYHAIRASLYDGIETSAASLVQILEELVAEHPDLLRPGALDAVVDRFTYKLPAVARLTVIGPDGRVRADSRPAAVAVDDATLLPLLSRVRETRFYFQADGQRFLRLNRSLRGHYSSTRRSDIVGAASLDMRLALTDAAVRRGLASEMVLVVALLLPIGALLYAVTQRSFVRPLEQLAEAGAQFARGDVPPPLAFSGRDELEVVARVFNEMVEERTRALTRTVDLLTASVAEVKVLQGILPICAECKRIRTQQDTWEQIESYVRDHTDAEFSHGICPECARKTWA